MCEVNLRLCAQFDLKKSENIKKNYRGFTLTFFRRKKELRLRNILRHFFSFEDNSILLDWLGI